MTKTSRREFVEGATPVLLASGWFGEDSFIGDLLDFGDDDDDDQLAEVFVGEDSETDDVTVEQNRLYFAFDTGAWYYPTDNTENWTQSEATGKNPVLESAVVGNLRTKNIGVSADMGSDLSVDSGSANETRLTIDTVDGNFFDDFGELDAQNNEFVLEHGSHHLITAHCLLESAAGTGQVILRIYVNDEQVTKAEGTTTTGNDLSASASINLKLEAGDTVHFTVEHSTGSTETFSGGNGGNYASCVRQ